MGLFLHKLLPVFLLPLGFSSLLILWGLVRRRRGWVLAGVLLLLAASLPVTGGTLLRVFENRFQHLEAADAPTADAIVVLSGMLHETPASWTRPEFGEGADRFEAGLSLWNAGRAPVLVFTRGQMPWDRRRTPEGEVLAGLATRRGVPAASIVLTAVVGDTAGEAREATRLAREHGWKRVLLVTSAYHLPRAVLLFRHAGIDVVPFPCDHHTAANGRPAAMSFLPSADGLRQTETALREAYGIMYYKVRYMFGTGGS